MARGDIVKRLTSFFKRLRRPTTLEPAPGSPRQPHQRYAPCHILDQAGIPNVLWFEDALVIYGSDTSVFDLYILVSDVSKAETALRKSDYRDASSADPPITERARRGWTRLECTGGDSTSITVLISASEWNYDLTHTLRHELGPLPPLNKFLDSLMTQWLDIPQDDYPEQYGWAMFIAVLIGYAYNLPSPNNDVRSPDYAEKLRPEVRELHYDAVGRYPRKSDFTNFRKHEYHALRCEQIRRGEFTPRPYPTDCFPVSLAEYPELTGMDIDIDAMSRRKGKKKRRLVSFSGSWMLVLGYPDIS